MMKIYATSLINSIQSVINTDNFKLTTYKDYDFLTQTQLCSTVINVRFYPESDGKKRDTMIIVNNVDITSAFIADWKTTAVGKFVTKDYKKDNRDWMNNTLYHEVKLSINNKHLKILVRLLNEISGELSEAEKKELITNYGDLTIDGKYFSIIKICDDTDTKNWGYTDIYHSRDYELGSVSGETNSFIETSDDDNDPNEIEDSTSSTPLF